jgi:alkanesulfonate monooxygenase SsuD/methylene tetrahydromethanopterin reductase-like flavin-dependent oxidoreductase (luciferase family)
MIERAKAAADAGLDSLFVGDHHVTSGPYYQNTPILGRVLAEWHDAPAGALYLLPFRHPVLLAEEIATLATIMPNRFIMQCGLGYGNREFAAFGINHSHRPSRFEQCLEIMWRLWAGETVSHQGRWQIQEAYISPTPPEPIEVWIAGSAEPAIERAARLGDGWLAAPGLTPEAAKTSLDYYLECCAKHNREPGVTAIRRDVYVGENGDEAQSIGGAVVAAGYRGFAPTATIVGDSEAVALDLQKYAAMGFSDVIIRNLVTDQAKALASTARLAQVKQLL